MAEGLNAKLGAAWGAVQARPALSSVILGLIAALGYPPVHAWYVAIPAIAAFVALLHLSDDWRSAAWRGWLFGWAHLTLANNWIATAFTYQAKMPEFLGWLAVPLLCIYLAVYPALASVTAHLIARGRGLTAFAFVFAGAWILFEWARSWVFTGYPWPPLGLILLGGWDTPGLARALPYLGTYALSGMAVLIAAAVARGVQRRHWKMLSLFAGLVALQMLLPQARTSPQEGTAFTLVQPLIPQEEINDGSKFDEHFARIAGLTMTERDKSRVVFWPESSIPDYLEDGYPQRHYDRMNAINPDTGRGDPEYARRRIGRVIGPQSSLLAGVVNLDIVQESGTSRAVSARNSVLGLNGEGEITHHYAKAHLVPYGEYLPMRPILEPLGLSRLVAGSIDYKPGPGPRTLDLGEHGMAGVQICYEIVFSGQVVDQSDRPDYLFNPSNDGWFGLWGPPQHLAQARLRAIEEGLPILRSTTTGISAVIDAQGVVLAHIPTGDSAAIEGIIPPAASPTLF
ncbi:MAG: apolipoprotein N-acyltransferase, partial [Pseudomonadota bacterium]|nr:apolipoprotein N-acyltransferase [Pseudomonadota bacterium]